MNILLSSSSKVKVLPGFVVSEQDGIYATQDDFITENEIIRSAKVLLKKRLTNNNTVLTSPNAVRDFLMLEYSSREYECFVVIFLNNKHKLLTAVEMFIDHPVAGVGWKKFNENVREYGHDRKILAHNTLLNVLAETGIIGFSCFIAILYYTFKQLWQIRKHLILIKEKSDLLILTQGILISFVCFMINTSFSVKDHDPIYWVLLALSGAIIGISQREMVILNK